MKPLRDLALARATLDRMAERRRDAAWVAAAWAAPHTRVLAVSGGRALVRADPDDLGLVLLPPERAPDGDRYLLGVDSEGTAYFAVSAVELPAVEGARAADLRGVGALLGDRDAGLLTEAVALDRWHAHHTHCPRCGTPTVPIAAGHVRRCPSDGSEHFPRVDPAVIMLVCDDADPDDPRCLLARHPDWPAGRYSVLAGFVEPGESLERAVAREVAEEVGVSVTDPVYLGSQPWPFPASLMLGFRVRAVGRRAIRVDAEEIAEAHWFTRAELREATAAERVRLPGRVSIARRMIEAWYGGELPGDW